jgi:hypothetical protein
MQEVLVKKVHLLLLNMFAIQYSYQEMLTLSIWAALQLPLQLQEVNCFSQRWIIRLKE